MSFLIDPSFGGEPEGACDRDNIPDDGSAFHHDGSVDVVGDNCGECDGSCRDDCSCSDYCDCDECQRCSECDSRMSSDRSECRCDISDYAGTDCAECRDLGLCENHREQYLERDTYTDCDWTCGCECSCSCDCYTGGLTDGEVVSPVMDLAQAVRWIKREKEFVPQSNRSCGHHWHFGGFSTEEYAMLMEEEFNDYFLQGMYRWGKACHINEDSAFWNRLEGHNTFCRRVFNPKVQRDMDDKGSDRYTQLNFCWSLHRTLEVRILPNFRKEALNLKAFYALYAIIRTYISRKKSERKDWTGSIVF